MSASLAPTCSRPLTGRMVLICLVAFFGTVFAMNAVMVRIAVSTFGGVETESSYKAGLTFRNDVAVARAQDARHWQVEASLAPENGGRHIVITARDADRRAVEGLFLEGRLSHPTDRRRDVVLMLVETAPGRFEGRTDAPAGQWDLTFALRRDETVLFRSKSRISL